MGYILRGEVCPKCGGWDTLGIAGDRENPENPEDEWECFQCGNIWVVLRREA